MCGCVLQRPFPSSVGLAGFHSISTSPSEPRLGVSAEALPECFYAVVPHTPVGPADFEKQLQPQRPYRPSLLTPHVNLRVFLGQARPGFFRVDSTAEDLLPSARIRSASLCCNWPGSPPRVWETFSGTSTFSTTCWDEGFHVLPLPLPRGLSIRLEHGPKSRLVRDFARHLQAPSGAPCWCP